MPSVQLGAPNQSVATPQGKQIIVKLFKETVPYNIFSDGFTGELYLLLSRHR